MKFRWALAAALVISGILVVTVLTDRPPNRSEYCTVKVGDLEGQVDLEQGQWASLMAGIGIQRALPPRATTIAIATAFQESKLHNIDYGDRDSVGLFQQRPSQGWGTVQQILDPHYSIGKFYDALIKIKGYQSMKITVAAQKVQRSAFGGAYAQHEEYARALASSLTGFSPAGFSCQIDPQSGGSIAAVDKDVQNAFGPTPAVISGDDLSYPVSGSKVTRTAHGWALAHYLVANASQLKITEVSFAGRLWTADNSPNGWIRQTDSKPDSVRTAVN